MKSVKTIEAKFLRSKTEAKKTSLWKNTSNDLQSIILKQISINTGEEPIIVFYKKLGNWLLVTNERLFVSKSDKISIIGIFEIEKVELKKIIEGTVSKEECSSVQLFFRNEWADLEVEPRTWSIMFSILSFMIC